MTPYILAVDPGSEGAVVRLGEDRALSVARFKGIEKPDWRQAIYQVANPSQPPIAIWYEDVHAFGDDFRPQLMAFGVNLGYVQALLDPLGSPNKKVDPQKWLRFHRLMGIEDRQERLRQCRDKAQAKFPEIKVTIDTGAAILIADYAWWQEWGY